jgi:hypothetical protein
MPLTTALPKELASEAAVVNGKAQKSTVLPRREQRRGSGREELWKNRAKAWGRTPHHWENSGNQQC